MAQGIDVLVQEVGPRDGLQAVRAVMPTQGKLEWISALKDAGFSAIQCGSFVPPKLLPQMADSAEVVKAAKAMGGFKVSALVPNLRGAENAIAAGADQLNFVMSASEPHNLNNVRKTHAQSLEEYARIADLVKGTDVILSGGLATCFGCTIAGPVDPDVVCTLVDRFLDIGTDRIGIADTVGYANPRQVAEMFTRIGQIAGDVAVGAHFHDTRGLGIANAYAAAEAGIRDFDGCTGGLGGCPYAPGATGNVVTEDLVFMFESMGLRTGINLDKLLAARAVMERHLTDEPTHGAFAKAGAPKGFVPATA
jgi:hydroxymethylglutaryl-CoA lyase